MDDSEHTAEIEPSLLVQDDEVDGDDYEEDYEDEEDYESEEDIADQKLNEYLAQLGIHVKLPNIGVIRVMPVHSRKSKGEARNLPIGTGALNSKSKIDEPYMILPGLYLGSEAHSRNEDDLKRLGVTHVVAIHDRAKAHFPRSFEYLLIPIYDDPGSTISKHFHDTHSFIREARETDGGAVFIHCWAGISRSATIVISYIMQLQRISYFEALDITLAAKPDVNPNHGFITQLKAYEKLIGTKSSGRSSQALQSGNSPRYPTASSSQPSKYDVRKAKNHGRYFEA